jgi:hypothetical protein
MGIRVRRTKKARLESVRRAALIRKANRIADQTGKDSKRVLAGLKGQATKERNKRSAAAKKGWENHWARVGRKLKPPRKSPPVEQTRAPKTEAKPPKPVKPKKSNRGTPKGEAQVMRERLEAVKLTVPDSTVLGPVINEDDTVDAELLVFIPRGFSVEDISFMVEEHLRAPAGQWITVGIRVPPNKTIENPEDYDRAMGLLQIEIHSRRSQYAGNMWMDWRDDVLPKIDKGTKGWRKPEQMFVRLFWSPNDERPD